MRRGVVICLAIVAICAVAGAGANEGKRFSTFTTCKPGAKNPDPYCIDGGRPTAAFTAHNQDQVAYKLCIRKPGGKRRCYQRRTGSAGVPSKVQIGAGRTGRYDLTWKVGGRMVDHDQLKVQKRRVFVNGDSLAEGTRPYLPRALKAWSVKQSVSISRHAPQGVAILRRMGNLTPVVVMQLGTNDDPRSTSTFRNAVEGTMKAVGRSGCVVWVNIVRPPVAGASYAGYNDILAEESRDRKNLRIVKWTEMIADNPGWLGSDRVHVNATGYQARAEAIAQQVKRC